MWIRHAQPGDADALEAVYRSAYRETRDLGFPMKAAEVTPEEVRRWMDEARLLVAVSSDEMLGAVRLEATANGYLKVSRLAVDQQYQREGIGSRLMDEAESIARQESFEGVRLTTPPDHPYLPAFYRERGYERVAEYPLPYRDYDEIVMELDLERSGDRG